MRNENKNRRKHKHENENEIFRITFYAFRNQMAEYVASLWTDFHTILYQLEILIVVSNTILWICVRNNSWTEWFEYFDESGDGGSDGAWTAADFIIVLKNTGKIRSI